MERAQDIRSSKGSRLVALPLNGAKFAVFALGLLQSSANLLGVSVALLQYFLQYSGVFGITQARTANSLFFQFKYSTYDQFYVDLHTN